MLSEVSCRTWCQCCRIPDMFLMTSASRDRTSLSSLRMMTFTTFTFHILLTTTRLLLRCMFCSIRQVSCSAIQCCFFSLILKREIWPFCQKRVRVTGILVSNAEWNYWKHKRWKQDSWTLTMHGIFISYFLIFKRYIHSVSMSQFFCYFIIGVSFTFLFLSRFNAFNVLILQCESALRI